MSTTPSFIKAFRPLPFCPGEPSGDVTFDVVRDLSLEQVMEFYWSVETAVFTLAGDAVNTVMGTDYFVYGNGTITLTPAALTGDYTNMTAWDWPDGGGPTPAWQIITDETLPVATADLPTESLAPQKRVCSDEYAYVATAGVHVDDFLPTSADFQFLVRSDDLNPGRYAIEWNMAIVVGSNSAGSTNTGFVWHNAGYNPAPSLTNVLNSGTFTIANIDFDWACNDDNNATGGDLDVTSSNFTYV